MTSNLGGKEVGAVDIDSPQLSHAINWVIDGFKVLCEASGSDEMINLAMLLDNFSNAALDRFGVRHIGEVGCNSGNSWK